MNPQKGNIGIIITIVIALLLGAGGYMLGIQKNNTNKIANDKIIADLNDSAKNSPKLQDKAVATNSSVKLDETANWKIYKNTAYGFELKYPKDWRIVEQSGFVGFGPQSMPEDTEFNIVKQLSIPSLGVSPVNSNQEVIKNEPIQFNGRSANKISIKNVGSGFVYSAIYFKTDNLWSITESSTDLSNPNFNQINSTILSTFKFTK